MAITYNVNICIGLWLCIDLLDRASYRSQARSYMDMMDGVSVSDNDLGYYVYIED